VAGRDAQIGAAVYKCGATYHVSFNKPKTEGKCDACGGELYQRADEGEETVKQRLNAYHAQTQPLIDYYNKKELVATVLGVGDIKGIFDKVAAALDKV